MYEYLENRYKILASKQYARFNIGRAQCPVGANPCMGEAKASSVQGFFLWGYVEIHNSSADDTDDADYS